MVSTRILATSAWVTLHRGVVCQPLLRFVHLDSARPSERGPVDCRFVEEQRSPHGLSLLVVVVAQTNPNSRASNGRGTPPVREGEEPNRWDSGVVRVP
jgi:hypothetical protein